MEFTYNSYKKMINIAKKNGYIFCSYHDEKLYSKSIILRHDVDFSLVKALELAEIEAKLGISSNYFLLVTSDFYNVFSKQSEKIINQIIELNHNIGLHFDEQKYSNYSCDDLKEKVIYEANLLSQLFKVPINVVSFHRPTTLTLEKDLSFDGIINSYSFKYFKLMKYVSDSRMCWRENITRLLENNEFDKLHILTHPFWYNVELENTREKLLNFIFSSKTERFNQINNNFRDLHEFLGLEDIL